MEWNEGVNFKLSFLIVRSELNAIVTFTIISWKEKNFNNIQVSIQFLKVFHKVIAIVINKEIDIC